MQEDQATPALEDNMSLEQLKETLGLTIKEDHTNKLMTFLVMLTNYTEDSQLNCAYVGPSSTGKSYIPLEIITLFPPEDLKCIMYSSPQAFFHETGKYDKEHNEITIDLSRKIIVFMDQPHVQLLQRLRPLLSHDQKDLTSKITDKTERGGNRTKSVRMIGYPVVVFCTAAQRLDEQEATRFILLSPELTADKIRAGVRQKIKKESDRKEYDRTLEADVARESLKRRIKGIKAAGVGNIKIANTDLLDRRFFESLGRPKPRYQRDISKVMGLTKALALLNHWHRKREGATIIANDEDIENAIELYREIAECQEYGLSPYVFNIYRDVMRAIWSPLCTGITRTEVRDKYFQTYGISLPDIKLRQEILPALEEAGLIIQVEDPADGRQRLIRILDGNEGQNNENNRE